MTTPNLGLALPTESQAQKTFTIANALSNLDRATQGDTALTITGNTAVTADEFTLGFSLELSGTPGSPFDLTVPSTKRFFRVENGADADATVKTASGTTVVVEAGEFRLLYCDGGNISEEGGGGGGGSVAIEDEGSVVVAAATAIDFKGAGVTAVDDGGNQAGVTIPGVESLEGGSSIVAGTSALDFDGDHFDVTDGGGGTTDIALADQSLETKVQRITTDQSFDENLTQCQWNDEVLDEFAGHDNSTDNERIVIGTEKVDASAVIKILLLGSNETIRARIVRYNSADALQEVVASTKAEEAEEITINAINVRGQAAGDYLVVDLLSADTGYNLDRTGSCFIVRRAASGGGGGVIAPTRTTVTLSGASTSVSIPAGCTWFKYISEAITLTTVTADLTMEIFNTGDTVRQTWNQLRDVIGTAATVLIQTGQDFLLFVSGSSSAPDRGLSGSVYAPRDATKKTLGDGIGYDPTGDQVRHRAGVAASADDDDTIRFVASAGTITGAVHIEWFYN